MTTNTPNLSFGIFKRHPLNRIWISIQILLVSLGFSLITGCVSPTQIADLRPATGAPITAGIMSPTSSPISRSTATVTRTPRLTPTAEPFAPTVSPSPTERPTVSTATPSLISPPEGGLYYGSAYTSTPTATRIPPSPKPRPTLTEAQRLQNRLQQEISAFQQRQLEGFVSSNYLSLNVGPYDILLPQDGQSQVPGVTLMGLDTNPARLDPVKTNSQVVYAGLVFMYQNSPTFKQMVGQYPIIAVVSDDVGLDAQGFTASENKYGFHDRVWFVRINIRAIIQRNQAGAFGEVVELLAHEFGRIVSAHVSDAVDDKQVWFSQVQNPIHQELIGLMSSDDQRGANMTFNSSAAMQH